MIKEGIYLGDLVSAAGVKYSERERKNVCRHGYLPLVGSL
jgi:hypothetical protein